MDKKGTLLSGLKTRSPKGMDDGSPKRPTRSVDEGAVRTSVAPTPKTLGPRDA